MTDLLVIMDTYERASKEELEKIFTKVMSFQLGRGLVHYILT